MDSDQIRETEVALLENRIRQIWNDILGAPGNRLDGTFLELGGQSISAIRIVARIEDELGVLVDLDELFDDPDRDSFVSRVAARAREPLAADGVVEAPVRGGGVAP